MAKIAVYKEPDGLFTVLIRHRKSTGLKTVGVFDCTREDVYDTVKSEQAEAIARIKASQGLTDRPNAG